MTDRYNAINAISRVVERAQEVDPAQLQVVVWHFVLERELDVMLDKLSRRPSGIRGFEAKARMLFALWDADGDRPKILLDVLLAFNDLRNKVAHGEAGFATTRANLFAACRKIDDTLADDAEYGVIVQNVCSYFGDFMPVGHLKIVIKLLEELDGKLP